MLNNVRGECSVRDAEEMCNMLVDLGKAIPADRWVHGLIKRNRQEGNLAACGKFF